MNARWLLVVPFALFVACNQRPIASPEVSSDIRFPPIGLDLAPKIVSVVPNNGQVALDLNQEIRIAFSRPMNPDYVYRSYSDNGFIGQGYMYMSDNNTVLHVVPDVWSSFGTWYAFSIAGKDQVHAGFTNATAANGYELAKTFNSSFKTTTGYQIRVTVDKFRVNDTLYSDGRLCGKFSLYAYAASQVFWELPCDDANALTMHNGDEIVVNSANRTIEAAIVSADSRRDVWISGDFGGITPLGQVGSWIDYYPYPASRAGGWVSLPASFHPQSEAELFGSFITDPTRRISIFYRIEKLYNLP